MSKESNRRLCMSRKTEYTFHSRTLCREYLNSYKLSPIASTVTSGEKKESGLLKSALFWNLIKLSSSHSTLNTHITKPNSNLNLQPCIFKIGSACSKMLG